MRFALSLLLPLLAAASCGYRDTTEGDGPGNAQEACALTCARLDALRCPAPLPASVVETCFADCQAFEEEARFAACEDPLHAWFECQGKQGNVRCAGANFEYVDTCSVRGDSAMACLEGRPPSSGVCPEAAPIDCGNGFCCPSSHPDCRAGGLCATGAGGVAGAAGSGG